MALSGNIGEWSEIYVLLKLIADQKVCLGDENLKKVANSSYKILSIIRQGKGEETTFSLDTVVTVKNEGVQIGSFNLWEFKNWAELLIKELKKHKTGEFTYEPINEFLQSINCKNVKASSNKKQDIVLQIYDAHTQLTPLLGFSIKSQLGSPSTLINASSHTNFTYELQDVMLTELQIEYVNNLSRFEDKLHYIQLQGSRLVLSKVDSPTFLNNLIMVDSLFPQIASEIVLFHYTGLARKMRLIADKLHQLNPLHYDLSHGHKFYHAKIKKFLSDFALGMMPSKAWNGLHEANGGYLIVTKEGDVICYHFYYKNLFEEYLLNNTKTETGDLKRIADSDKNPTGVIYNINDRQYLKLNLQVRFLV